jgi:hypothetical protein
MRICLAAVVLTVAVAPAVAQPVRPRDPCAWHMVAEASLWAGVGSDGDDDPAFTLRDSFGVQLRPCEQLRFRAGLGLSLWADLDDADQKHATMGMYRVGPELAIDVWRYGRLRAGVWAAFDLAFGQAREGAADLAIHVGPRLYLEGFYVGVTISHGLGVHDVDRGPTLPPTRIDPTVVMFGLGQTGRVPWIAYVAQVVAYAITVNTIHRN